LEKNEEYSSSIPYQNLLRGIITMKTLADFIICNRIIIIALVVFLTLITGYQMIKVKS
jgi:hypothetical protein